MGGQNEVLYDVLHYRIVYSDIFGRRWCLECNIWWSCKNCLTCSAVLYLFIGDSRLLRLCQYWLSHNLKYLQKMCILECKFACKYTLISYLIDNKNGLPLTLLIALRQRTYKSQDYINLPCYGRGYDLSILGSSFFGSLITLNK